MNGPISPRHGLPGPHRPFLDLQHHLSLTELDAIFATRDGHVVTVQDDADQVEAAHEIDDLRRTLLAERVYARVKYSLGQGSTPVQGGGNVVGDRFVPGQSVGRFRMGKESDLHEI